MFSGVRKSLITLKIFITSKNPTLKTERLPRNQLISKNFRKIGHLLLEKSFLNLEICGVEKIAFKVLVSYYSECRHYKFMKILVFGTKCSILQCVSCF